MSLSQIIRAFGRWCGANAGTLIAVSLMALALFILLDFVDDAKPLSELRNSVQERADAGQLPTEKQVRGTGHYWASLGNTVLLAVLILTSWWWSRPISDSRLGLASTHKKAGDRGHLHGRQRLGFFIALLIIISGAAGLRWNLVSGSMWWDEAWAMQNVYHGDFYDYDHENEVHLEFIDYASNWQRALWRYWSPLNHPIASFSSQAVHIIAQPIGSEFPHGFKEWLLRLPAFSAGLLAILLIALTIARWGFPAAALVAAIVLAVHPWAIRHTSEIRAYPFLLAGAATALYSITVIVQSKAGQWWGWIGFAFAQLLLVWSHVFAASLALLFTIFLFIAIFVVWPERTDRLRAIARLTVVNLLAAAGFFQLFGPNIVQAASWAESFAEGDGNHLDLAALGRLLSLATTGMLWDIGDTTEASQLASVKTTFATHPILLVLAGLTVLMASAAGGLRLWRSFRVGAWLLLALLGGGALTLAVISVGNSYFYPRFLIYLLIPMATLFAIGATRSIPISWDGKKAIPPALVATLTLLLYVFAVAPQISVLNRSSIEPLRELAHDIQQFEKLHHRGARDVHVAGIGHGSERVRLYFPQLAPVREIGALETMIATATSRGNELLVFAGHRYFNQVSHPDLMAVVQDKSRFEELQVYPGISPDFFYRLYRFRPLNESSTITQTQ